MENLCVNECIERLAGLYGGSRRVDSGVCAIERWIMHRKEVLIMVLLYSSPDV